MTNIICCQSSWKLYALKPIEYPFCLSVIQIIYEISCQMIITEFGKYIRGTPSVTIIYFLRSPLKFYCRNQTNCSVRRLKGSLWAIKKVKTLIDWFNELSFFVLFRYNVTLQWAVSSINRDPIKRQALYFSSFDLLKRHLWSTQTKVF